MLPLLAVSLILCLFSIPGNGWAKKLPPKTQNEFVVASFCLKISPMVSCPFHEKRALNQVIFNIPFCVLSTSYVEIILEATISRVPPPPRCRNMGTYYKTGKYYETFWSVLRPSRIFSTQVYRVLWHIHTECQIIIIHFLLLIYHKLPAISKCWPLPYSLPNIISLIVITIATQLMVYS